jgi:DNA-binding beta-propeller fold protein YncE
MTHAPGIRTRRGAATLALTALLAAAGARADAPYSIVARWKTGGSGGWDYLTVDAARGRLFVTRGDHVEVLATKDGAVLGRIANTQGVHGVALAPELKRGYTSNGRANTVTEFDYDTLATLREVAVTGQNPDAILYEPASRRLLTFNGRSKNATVLDAATLTVVATLPVPDKPEFAVTDEHGRVFVNIESDPGRLLVIDAAKATITANWPLPGCDSPTGLALDAKHSQLFSVCDGNVMAVTDAATGQQLAKVAIGAGPDAAAVDTARGLVFSSNGDGTLSIVRADAKAGFPVVGTLTTQRGARTMALDPTTGRIFLVTADFGPPPPATPDQPHPRPAQLPDTFTVLVAAPR